MTKDYLVTINDLRKCNFCGKDILAWCKRTGVDFKKLVKHGVMLSELQKHNDAYVERVADLVRTRDGQQET